MSTTEGEQNIPTYQQATAAPQSMQGIIQSTTCSYVDFSPACLSQGGMFSLPTYERFDILLGKANTWLASNPQWKVMSCESLESKVQNQHAADTASSIYYESGKYTSFYHRSIRLWITNKAASDPPEPQQIGYLNIIPGCTERGGTFSLPKFENLTSTIEKFNAMIAVQPIQGRIINMETQNMKFENWDESVDPESCFWGESGKYNTFFLNIIRVFFEVGTGIISHIGTVDFVPARLSPDRVFTPGTFERFADIVARANNWISQQPPAFNICNVQSIDYKVSSTWGGDTADTMESLYRESGRYTTAYLRILRVYWTQDMNNASPPRAYPLQLSYRTFMPVQLTAHSMMGVGKYETQVETMKRALAWFQATGAKAFSCETVPTLFNFANNYGDSEATYTFNSGKYTQAYVVALRVYLDGVYNDPPPEMLPPIPQIQVSDSTCCNIL